MWANCMCLSVIIVLLNVFLIPQPTNRRLLLCKKKVWFKSPITEIKHCPANKLTRSDANEPLQTSTPVAHTKTEQDLSKESCTDSTDTLKVRLKGSIKNSPKTATFFDFISDSDRDAFFERMRERCVKLRSIPLFPLTAETK